MPRPRYDPISKLRRFAHELFVLACVALALARAYALRWTCDDAFISFRYAQNLAEGRGLVFNAGERVEGYTNFLWTVAITPANWLGITPEAWTQVLGATAYALTVLLLGALYVALARRPTLLPFACLAAASHKDWAIFAVSGLETAAFTCAAVAGFAALVWPSRRDARVVRAATAGLLFGVATLLRPDGVLFGAVVALYLGALTVRASRREDPARRRAASALTAFVAVFAVIVGAHLAFRLHYYGDLLPNTFYAKSADRAWFAQGLTYLWSYLLRYPPVAVAPLAMAWVFARRRASPHKLADPAALALALGAAHALWTVQVGGDFMFARFLIPSTPFFLFVLEVALLDAHEAGVRGARALAAGSVAAIAFLPAPLLPDELESGVADEHAYYSPERVERLEARARAVGPILEGLDARVAFFSSQARLVYRAQIPVAVESETGLTDAYIARQRLPKRRRVGHEKRAPAAYLVDVRRLHLALSGRKRAALDAYIPHVPLSIGGVSMRLLHWDPAFVRGLRARGVEVLDYPSMLDARAPMLDALPREDVEAEYARARHFYFAFVSDPARERVFLDRLARD